MKNFSTHFFKFFHSTQLNWLFLFLITGIQFTAAKSTILHPPNIAVDKTSVEIQQDTPNTPPRVVQKPVNQTILPGERFYFTAGEFSDPDVGDQLTYTANLTNGQALPTWLKFNAANLSFRGIAPTQDTTLVLQIIATDTKQDSVSTSFKVIVQKANPVEITGELKKWHKVTFTFAGPLTSETDSINPFLDYRLNIIFKKGTRRIVVPGYYTANGNSARTGVSSGNKWRAHFTPDETGEWTYTVSFRTGSNIAINTISYAGRSLSFNGVSGSFTVANSDKTGRDFRAQGRLQYTGQHYLQFAETKKCFLKGGAGSPENFLAYKDFDGTYSQRPAKDYTKTYEAHIVDWKPGDPVWRGNKGKGIIGALNYLASKGMNSVYFLTMNVDGDGQDVWPWISPTIRDRYDVSKLAQWETVFSHMDKLGIMLHVITQEQENDQLLDGGALKTQRKLYYRELIARFGHHLGITWNMGEENTNTDHQRKSFSYYFKRIDPYNSPIDVHTFPAQKEKDAVFRPLLGYKNFEGASLQVYDIADVHKETVSWVNQSAAKGRNWVVTLDEIGPSYLGVLPDAKDFAHDQVRKQALWGHLMAGGGGVEWYFGYQQVHSDLTAQDWRSRKHMWELTRNALQFFNQYLPFWEMHSVDSLTSSTTDYCLAAPGKVYAVYLPKGGTTTLNLGDSTGTYLVNWYNPRTGQPLQEGSVLKLSGSGVKSVGLPPKNDKQDWVCLITKSEVVISKSVSATLNALVTEDTHDPVISVAVFPNPIQDYLTVQVNTNLKTPLEITLQDITGKQIMAVSAAAKNEYVQLKTSHLKPGVYLLQVKNGSTTTTQKIIKY